MEKQIYDENNGLWYELHGDYYLPCLSLPDEEQEAIGIWGQRHLRYIKKNKRSLYTDLLTSGRLNSYLTDVDTHAAEMFSLLVKQLAEKKSITKKLKAENQMEWIQQMNAVREIATEIVNNDLIYA